MRRLTLSLLAACALAAILAGCDSAASTPVAPDQKMPDTSKMSAEEIEKAHRQGDAGR